MVEHFFTSIFLTGPTKIGFKIFLPILLKFSFDGIISDIPVKTTLKNEIAKIMFSEKDYSDKRILVKKLRTKGLSDLYIRMLLRLLEYTSNKK